MTGVRAPLSRPLTERFADMKRRHMREPTLSTCEPSSSVEPTTLAQDAAAPVPPRTVAEPTRRSIAKDQQATLALQIQRSASRVALPLLGPAAFLYLRGIGRYRIANLRDIRRTYRRAMEQRRPTMICANHLTMIDSLLLHYALGSATSYVRHFHRLAWNVAASENFFSNSVLRTIAFLGKTIPVEREGSPEHLQMVLDQIRRLLSEGDVVTLFPEGTRSRTGYIEPDAVTYGVGKVLKDFTRPLVVCVYLRGRHQRVCSTVPPPGDEIYVDVELVEPVTEEKGLRAGRAISRQIIHVLKNMEERYFSQLARAID